MSQLFCFLVIELLSGHRRLTYHAQHPGRRVDGTFLPGSDVAKEAGHKGGEVNAAAVAAQDRK